MAKIKAYTDIQQSKRLAKILPLESADMEYILEHWIDEKTGRHKEEYCEIPVVKVDDDCILQPITHPCWSLVALFNTLPKTIGSYSKMMGYFDNAYHCDYIDEDGECLGNGTTADTLIDAVYEMVLKQNKKRNNYDYMRICWHREKFLGQTLPYGNGFRIHPI